ncbi:ATP-binding protein [Streptomyces sp. NPDC048564]|uniref:sensor histidine kinase n=1 Tax=Streptomyces sp. NPDC048564 TaxID=3155760 RepID=UPI003444EBA6
MKKRHLSVYGTGDNDDPESRRRQLFSTPFSDRSVEVQYTVSASTATSHWHRALRVQALLRVVVALALNVELSAFPPTSNSGTAVVIVCGYTVWSAALLITPLSKRLLRRVAWLPLCVDLVTVTVLLAVCGDVADDTWASPLASDLYLLIPLFGAPFLPPRITAVGGLLSALAFTGAVVMRWHTDPYWDRSWITSVFILVMTAAAVRISVLQKSRLHLIGMLVQQRSRLLNQVMSAEERERNELAETLHDGALQNVLAARHELEDAVAGNTGTALANVDALLYEVTAQLRRLVKDLHSEVLESSGLAGGLDVLAEQFASRSGLRVTVMCKLDSVGPADRLLYSAARELLTNVVKHAQARQAWVALTPVGLERVELCVADDGVGMDAADLDKRAAEGHIGLISQRLRIEGANGTFTVGPNHPHGTCVRITLPVASTEGR